VWGEGLEDGVLELSVLAWVQQPLFLLDCLSQLILRLFG
jgi:hypothetical protein